MDGFFNDFFGDFVDGSERLISKLKILANPAKSIISAPIDKLKSAAAEWEKDYNALVSIPDSQLSPELIAEKNALIKRGGSIISKIKLMGYTSDNMSKNGLEIAPLIAGGVIATAAGLMLYWTTDYIKFKERMAEYKTLRASGVSAKAATKIVNDIVAKPSIFSDMSTAMKTGGILAGGTALYFVAKNNKWI